MKVHHLNCGSLCPFLGKAAVTHCLLIETANSGLVLVDSGIGDVVASNPKRHMSWINRVTLRPRFAPNESALSQIKALGYKREDVRHIALTHLDIDHAGGLLDFPGATLHVMDLELATAQLKRDPRYDGRLWAHVREPITYVAGSDEWLGMTCAGKLRGVDEDVLLIPLPGHTQGHAGVAVPLSNQTWLLHAGDAFLIRQELHREPVPWATRLGARITSANWRLRADNLERLRELAVLDNPSVAVISSHCKEQWEDCERQATSPGPFGVNK